MWRRKSARVQPQGFCVTHKKIHQSKCSYSKVKIKIMPSDWLISIRLKSGPLWVHGRIPNFTASTYILRIYKYMWRKLAVNFGTQPKLRLERERQSLSFSLYTSLVAHARSISLREIGRVAFVCMYYILDILCVCTRRTCVYLSCFVFF